MKAVKTMSFHLLYTFRGLFRGICKVVSGLYIIGFLGSLFLGGNVKLTITALVCAVLFGALAWYYDILILKLKPDNVDLQLYQ